MPAEFVFQILFRFLFEVVAYSVGYLTGKVLIRVFTLGRWSSEFVDKPSRARKRGERRADRRSGAKVVSADTTVFIGALFWAVVILLGFVLAGLSRG
jgi:hypothetical protein